MSGRRVVVTGLGAVTPAGNDAPSTWRSLVAGRSAVRLLSFLKDEKLPVRIGAEVRGFEPEKIRARQDARRFGRSTQLALAAAVEAFESAGLRKAAPDPARCGVILGTGIGDASEHVRNVRSFDAKGAPAVHPLYVTRVMPNAAVAAVSFEFGFRGPSLATATACAAAGHAVGSALRLIQHGEANLVLAGGAEELATPLMLAAFDALRALSRRNDAPEKASRPFERGRDGFVLGEGAGVLVLEEREHALRRGARIRAEVLGAGMASDAHHLVAPDPDGEGAALAIKGALADAGRRPEEVQYVNAHGTSTPLNDKVETLALHRVFGDHARRLAVSATKSMIGHLVGGAAAIGLLAAIGAIEEGVVHPTINYEAPDPECDLDYVPNEARKMEVRLALVNAFGFGGHCVSILVGRPSA